MAIKSRPSGVIDRGAAPAVCAPLLAPPATPWQDVLAWLAAAAYCACAITRLGFYNLTAEEVRGFVGLPVPVAALIWSSR